MQALQPTQSNPGTVLELLVSLPGFFIILGLAALIWVILTIIGFIQGREVSLWLPKIGQRPDTASGGTVRHSRSASRKRSSEPYAGVIIEGFWEMRDWRHDYGYEHEDVDKCRDLEKKDKAAKHDSQARLEQEADQVHGWFSHRDWKGKPVNYELEGTIQDLIVTGTWRETATDRDTKWFGTFQFLVGKDRDEKIMLGRWTGINAHENQVHCGVWEWRQKTKKGASSSRDWPSETGLLGKFSSFYPLSTTREGPDSKPLPDSDAEGIR